MLLSQPKTIEEYIVMELGKSGSQKVAQLVALIIEIHPKNPSSQGIYKSLAELKDQEVVSVTNGTVHLHNHWIDSLSDYVALAKYRNTSGSGEKNFLQLSEGERITYHFNSALEADIFWAHSFSLLMDIMEPGQSIFNYDPHNWFVLTSRDESEIRLIKKTKKLKLKYFVTYSSNYFLDKLAKKKFKIANNVRYNNLDKPLFKNNYYVGIFNDFLVEVYMDKETSNQIDNFFKTKTEYNKNEYEELESIVKKRGKARMVISRNKNKADKIITKLSKDFAII